MRSFIFRLAAVSFIGVASVSQAVIPRLGIQGGVSIAGYNAPAGFTADNVTGFAAGLALELPFSDLLSIQPEAIYTQRGATIAGGTTNNVSSKVHSIDVPVFLRLNFGKEVKPYVFVGPNFTFNVANSLEVNAGGSLGALTFNPNSVDFGFAAGAGLELGMFFVNFRYLGGLLNVNNSGASWTNRGFLVMAGLNF